MHNLEAVIELNKFILIIILPLQDFYFIQSNVSYPVWIKCILNPVKIL